MRHHWFLMLLPILLFASLAEAQPRQERPRPSTTIPAELVADMTRAWDQARNPSVLLMFGAGVDGEVRYDLMDARLERLAAPMTRELSRAFPGGIVSLDVQAAREQALIDRLSRNVGEDLAPEAAQALSDRFDADVIIDVVLLPAGGSRVSTHMTAVDTRQAREIARSSLMAADLQADPRTAFVFGASLAKTFGEGFVNLMGPGRQPRAQTFELRLIALDGGDGLTSRDGRRLSRSIEREVRGVAWAETEEAVEQDQRFIRLEVRYDGRLRDLLDEIEDVVLPEMELGWNLMETEGVAANALTYRMERPRWHLLTDPSSPEAQLLKRERIAALARDGSPRLAVLAGRELEERGFETIADPDSRAVPLNVELLRAALENELSALGFRITDAAALQRVREKELLNSDRYEDLPHMRESLAAIDAVDLILHLNELPDDRGGQIVARLFDPASGDFIGSQRWPDVAASRLRAYSVDSRRPSEVARFIAGRLLDRWDRRASSDVRTADLQIRNAASAPEILAVIEALRSGVPGIRSVDDVQIQTPVATMEVAYALEPSLFMLQTLEALGSAFPGAEIQRIGDGLIVNLKPVVRTEEQVAAIREQQIALAPKEEAPAEEPAEEPGEEPTDNSGSGSGSETPEPRPAVSASAGSSQDRLVEVLRSARDSVWLIVVETEDSSWTGTGWTVADGLLATNAHVVSDVPERLARGETVTAIAVSDADVARRLKLGKAWRHPKWGSAEGAFWYDVGLFEIVEGDPGQPLPLASRDELNQLVPPVITGYVGFPSKDVLKSDIPAKQAFLGQINAILDTTLTPNASARDRMVTHNMLSAKGASGSPILNADGRVVAVHNSGMSVEVQTVDNAGRSARDLVKSGFNGGVMADVLADFIRSLEPKRPARR